MLKIKKHILLVSCFFCATILSSVSKHQITIQQRIQQVSNSVPGDIGVCALHIESNKRIEFNGNGRFPMASTYKLPIALCCLSLVDEGKLNLQTKKVITKYNKRRYGFVNVGDNLSIKKLIQLMIEKSGSKNIIVTLSLTTIRKN